MIDKCSKIAVIAIAAFSLAIPSISSANQVSASDATTVEASDDDKVDIHNGFQIGGGLEKRIRLADGSLATSASSYYFKIGVKRFKAGNWDAAEEAFEKVLLTNNLNKQAYFYLAHINSEQGDEAQVVKYVKAYHGFRESYVTPECIALVASSDLGLVSLVESVNSGITPQEELTSKIIELTKSLGPDFAQTCKLVSKSRAGHADFLIDE